MDADDDLWGSPDLWLGLADPDDDGDDDTDLYVDSGDPVA